MIAAETGEGPDRPPDRLPVFSGEQRFAVKPGCSQKLGRQIDLAAAGMLRQEQKQACDRSGATPA